MFKKLVSILFVIVVSCGPNLKKTVNYKIALNELANQDFSENYILITAKEMNKRRLILPKNDTMYLTRSRNEFAFRHIESKEIIIYKFGYNPTYKVIKCDSNWVVYEVSEYMGEVY